jgi:hypothetical protein
LLAISRTGTVRTSIEGAGLIQKYQTAAASTTNNTGNVIQRGVEDFFSGLRSMRN